VIHTASGSLSYGSRDEELRGLFDTSGLCLEIGPSYNPLLPKRNGYRVESVDYCDAPALRAKYAPNPDVDTSRIEDVDHVWRGEPLSTLVGVGRFDVVVASHVIEHTPDMLGFLHECEKTLAPGGRLVLVVPDRRRCFDFFRPASTTGSVLQAHLERRTRHTPGTAFDFIANFSEFDGQLGTGAATAEHFTLAHSLAAAHAAFETFAVEGDYQDCHAWVFTPSSFRLILSDLATIGALELREEGFWTTPIFEFVTILSRPDLSRSGSGCPLDRPELLAMSQEEAGLPAAPRPAARP
jgi:SAM-dependent methyltransferase